MNFSCNTGLPKISNDYLTDVLKERGVSDVERYLSVDRKDFTDGYKLSNMHEALTTVHDAIASKSKIAISVDSDTDGYTSAAIMYNYIKDVDPKAEIKYYIHEGKQHGIEDFVEDLIEYNPGLVIIPDASSSEWPVHKTLNEAGMNLVILDHHLSDVTDEMDCWAVRVNNQLSPEFPNKTLCGAGVVFKFCQCYDDTYGYNFADQYIDLAAVGLVGDMMDLRNYETRYMVSYGLSHIKNAGLKHFVEALHYSLNDRTELTPTDVAFYIAPCINAIIRVGTQTSKEILFTCLLDGDRIVPSTKKGHKEGDTEILGAQAARIANNAKNLQKRLIERAMDVVEAKIFKYDLLENKIILVPISEEDDILSTLTGLVAMKVTAKYHKPALILHECADGILKGSGRAEMGTEMGGFKEYLEQSQFFDYSAGHSMAFGAGIDEKKVSDFLEFANNQLKAVDFNEKSYSVDYLFGEKDDFSEMILDLDRGHDIWGQGVSEPVIGVKDIPLTKDDIVIMKNNCMKFTYNNVTYVIFKNEQAIQDFTEHDKMIVSIYGKGNVNEWCGRKTCQLLINDYEVKKRGYVF